MSGTVRGRGNEARKVKLFVLSHTASEGGRVVNPGNLPPESAPFTSKPCWWGRLTPLKNISRIANNCIVCGGNSPVSFTPWWLSRSEITLPIYLFICSSLVSHLPPLLKCKLLEGKEATFVYPLNTYLLSINCVWKSTVISAAETSKIQALAL